MQRSFFVLLALVVSGVAATFHFTERSSRAEGSACACVGEAPAIVTVYAVVDLLRRGATEESIRRRVEPVTTSESRPGALVVNATPCVQARVQAALTEVRRELAPVHRTASRAPDRPD